MGTKEELSIEELGAEVSSSVLTPLRFLERSAACGETGPPSSTASRPGPTPSTTSACAAPRPPCATSSRSGRATASRCCSPTSHSMLELHYAVPGVGGVLVPLNTRLADKEYDYILEHCGAKVLVADRELDTDLRVVSLDEYEELVEAADPVERSSAPRTSAR